jgi:hypothetical protein
MLQLPAVLINEFHFSAVLKCLNPLFVGIFVPLLQSTACGYSSGESRSAATAVGSASVDANADYESANQLQALAMNDERRLALEEKTVQRPRVSTVREMMDWPVA